MEKYIGHRRILNGLKKRIDKNTLSHAHLIVGEDGIGKSKLANIFASMILKKPPFKHYVDSIEYKPKKSTIGVDEVRGIIEEIHKKPYEGNKKVIIIYNGEKLTVQAQNALLKTIEEPPYGVYIIILTVSLDNILDTIKSRCQINKLSPLHKEEIKEYYMLKKLDSYNINFNSAFIYSNGIPGRLEKFMIDNKVKEIRELVLNLLYDINSEKDDLVLDYEKRILKFKDDKEEFINTLEYFVRDIIIYKELNDKTIIINSDKISDIEKLVELMSYKKLNFMIDAILDMRKDIKYNLSFTISLNVLLMKFL